MDAHALVSTYYEAFNKGDVEGMIACLHTDFVHDVNEGERRDGIERFRAFCQHMNRCYKERLADIATMVSADGRRAAAEFVVHGEYLETDEGLPPAKRQRYVLPAGAFFDIRDGRIARVTTRYNLNDWIRQVGGA